jgi:hypothetical protein
MTEVMRLVDKEQVARSLGARRTQVGEMLAAPGRRDSPERSATSVAVMYGTRMRCRAGLTPRTSRRPKQSA